MSNARPSHSKSRGILITFEGTEGAGKSTLIRELSILLQQRSIQVTTTREPGGNAVAEKIRSLILNDPMDPWCELFLYEAARAEHLSKILLPALHAGHWVLCDRFTDSSLAYQAHARGLPWARVKTLNQIATQGLKPHLTVMLDIDPEVGLRRAKDGNRFEEEGVAFQKKVREGFLKSKKEDPRRWLTIASQDGTPIENANKVLKLLIKRFPKSFKQKN